MTRKKPTPEQRAAVRAAAAKARPMRAAWPPIPDEAMLAEEAERQFSRLIVDAYEEKEWEEQQEARKFLALYGEAEEEDRTRTLIASLIRA